MAPGLKEFPLTAKVEIARLLDEVGVQEIGLNPGLYSETVWGDADLEGARAISAAGLKLKVIASMEDKSWLLGDYAYIDKTIDAGVNGIELLMSVRMYRAPGHPEAPVLREADGKTRTDVDQAVARALEYIRSKGIIAGMMLGGYGGRNLDELAEDMNRYLDYGVERFRIGDGTGRLNPDATRYAVGYLRGRLRKDVRLTYHAHNPFGAATAVTLAAASAGACPEVQVNAFSDKGGAGLEEVVLALEFWYGVRTGIKMEGLSGLCVAVQEITGVKNHPFKAVVGDAMYAPCWGWQYKELLAGNDAIGAHMAPYNPEVIGSRVNMVWSANILEAGVVRAKLDQMGLSYSEEDVQAIIRTIHVRLKAMSKYPAWLTDAEVEQICYQRKA